MLTALIDYLTVPLQYIDRQTFGRAWALPPKFDHATAWYTHVSTILKILSLAFNTVNNLCLQALMTSL